MPRHISPGRGADKVNETGEPTFQKIYEPLGTPRGCGNLSSRRGAGRPDAQTGRGRTHVDRENWRAASYVCVRDPDRVSADFDIHCPVPCLLNRIKARKKFKVIRSSCQNLTHFTCPKWFTHKF